MATDRTQVTSEDLDLLSQSIANNASSSQPVTTETTTTPSTTEAPLDFSVESLSTLVGKPAEASPSPFSVENLNSLLGVETPEAGSQTGSEIAVLEKAEKDPNAKSREILGDGITDLINSLSAGTLETASDVTQGFSRAGESIFGDGEDLKANPLFQVGTSIDEFSDASFKISPEAEGKLQNQIAKGIGQVLGLVGGAKAATAAGLSSAASFGLTALIGMATAGNQQAKDYIQSVGEGDATAEGEESAFLAGAPLGIVDSLIPFFTFGKADKATGGLMSKIFKGNMGKLSQTFAGKTAVTAMGEAITEMTQEGVANLIASDILEYDSERKVLTGLAEAGQVGAGVGVAMNLLAAALPGKVTIKSGTPGSQPTDAPKGTFESIEAAGKETIESSDIDPDIKSPEQATVEQAVAVDADGDVTSPLSNQKFTSEEVKQTYTEAAQSATEKFIAEEEGLSDDSATANAKILASITQLQTLADSNPDSPAAIEASEVIDFLQGVSESSSVIDTNNIENKQAVAEVRTPEELDNLPQDKKDQVEAFRADTALPVTEEAVSTEQSDVESPALDAEQNTPVSDTAIEEASAENRQALGLRQAIDDLSPQQKDEVIQGLRGDVKTLTKRLYTSEVAGIPNKAAFTDAEPTDLVASIDIDSLKFLNDNLGHKGGDDLIKSVAQAINKQFPDNSFHVSGDELVVTGNDPAEMEAGLKKAQEELSSAVIEGLDVASGRSASQQGLGFTYGISTDLSLADAEMLRSKEEKTTQGLRAARGEAPSGFKIAEPETFDQEILDEVADIGGMTFDEVSEASAELDAEIAVAREDALFDPEVLSQMRSQAKEFRQVIKAARAMEVKQSAISLEAPTPDQSHADFLTESFLSEEAGVGAVAEAVTIVDNSEISFDTVDPTVSADQAPEVSPAVEVVESFKSKLSSETLKALDVFVAEDYANLPADVRKELKNKPGVKAVYTKANTDSKASLILIGNTFQSSADATRTILHEVVGHHGLREILPETEYNNLLRRTLNLNPAIRNDILSKVVRWRSYLEVWTASSGNPLDLPASERTTFTTPQGVKIEIPNDVALRLADEYLADLAAKRLLSEDFVTTRLGLDQTGSRNSQKIQAAFDRTLKALRHMLRKVFGKFSDDFTIEDVNAAIAKSADNLFKNTPLDFYKGAKFSDNGSITETLSPADIDLTEGSILATTEAKVAASLIASEQSSPNVNIQEAVRLASSLDPKMARVSMTNWGTNISKRMNRRFSAGLKSMGNLKGKDSLKQIQRAVASKNTDIDGFLASGQSHLQGLSPLQHKLVLRFMRSKTYNVDSLPIPQAAREFILESKIRIEKVGETLKDAGMLSEASFEENRGAYLTTLYTKYMTEVTRKGKKTSFLNWAKAKKDIPSEIKKELGEITDPFILISETLGTLSHDAMILDFYKNINQYSNQQGLLWILDTDKKVKYTRQTSSGPRVSEVTPTELNKIRGRLAFAIQEEVSLLEGAETSPELALLETNLGIVERLIETTRQEISAELSESIKKSAEVSGEINQEGFQPDQYVEDNYRVVPSKSRYGALAGKYVRKEIYKDLIAPAEHVKQDTAFAKAWQAGTTLNRYWKASKALISPAQHARNLVGALSFLDLSSSRNSATISKWAFDAVTDRWMGKQSEWSAIHDRVAGDSATFAGEELDIAKKETFKILVEKQKALQLNNSTIGRMELTSTLTEMLSVGRDFVDQEVIDRSGRYLQRMERGMKDTAIRDFLEQWNDKNKADFRDLPVVERDALFIRAVDQANDALFDYSQIPDFIKSLRTSPFGAPFITFTYKAIPAMTKGYLNNPHKLAQHAAVPSAVTALALTMLDDFSLEDEEYLKGLLPDWMAATGSTMFLPFKDEDGTPQLMDVSFMVPFTQFTKILHSAIAPVFDGTLDGGEKAVEVLRGINQSFWDTSGVLTGAIPTALMGLMSNEDNFGRPIIDYNQPLSGVMMDITTAFYDLMAPTALTSTGPAVKIFQGVMDNVPTDSKGRTKFTTSQGVFSLAGFPVRKFDEQKLREGVGFDFKRRKRELDKARRKVLRTEDNDMDRVGKLKFLNNRQRQNVLRKNKRLGNIE